VAAGEVRGGGGSRIGTEGEGGTAGLVREGVAWVGRGSEGGGGGREGSGAGEGVVTTGVEVWFLLLFIILFW
jgi:hypothetical protein